MSSVTAREVGVVTIDGLAASGKSSVARGVAHALGVPFVSSGLLYRAATHLVTSAGVDPRDEAAALACLLAHDVQLEPDVGANLVRIDGSDVTASLHTAEVDAGVSLIAAHPRVRQWVSRRLREVPAPFVVDGRDMGSAVFPGARHKFYLTASLEERARRRAGERSAELAAVTEAIARRDELDAKQSAPAPDARLVDTDELNLEGVVAKVLDALRECGVEAPSRPGSNRVHNGVAS